MWIWPSAAKLCPSKSPHDLFFTAPDNFRDYQYSNMLSTFCEIGDCRGSNADSWRIVILSVRAKDLPLGTKARFFAEYRSE
jgi:hypothetical protein